MALKILRYGDLRAASQVGVGGALHEVHTASAGQTDILLTGSYRVGVHELNVHLNGVFQVVDIDYIELNNKTIQFIEPLEADDQVVLRVSEVRNTSLHYEFTASAGQTVFNLPNPYRAGMNTLLVFIDGMLSRIVDDYIEVNDTTIQFHDPLHEGAKITFHEIV
jgi:hypothetical protein